MSIFRMGQRVRLKSIPSYSGEVRDIIKSSTGESLYKVLGTWFYESNLEADPDSPPDTLPMIPVAKRAKGATCKGKNCIEPYCAWAEPNQADGTFLCWSCRNGILR